ncbi:MAG: DUF3473 domain-containing protein [Rhodospirillales bacterium]|nr:DUF3473 domain-containing protein [Rhodospirillales bacterium]
MNSEPVADMDFSIKKFTPPRRNGRLINAMTVDVEDYFQVQAFANHVGRSEWDGQECRLERNTERVLELFSDAGIKATFFTLGWVAERYGPLIRRIAEEGHEVASHGYAHFRADEQSPKEFRDDIRRTKKILEDASGTPIRGYRAATFSIGESNLWTFEILAEEGYSYSSSIYPVRHDYYGMPGAPRFPFRPTRQNQITEHPITTTRMAGRNFPCGGGGYFRLLPYELSRWAMKRVNNTDEMPCIFYFHPWEIDPHQPRMQGVTLKSRLRHYTNLGRMEGRLRRLLADFNWDRMDSVFS